MTGDPETLTTTFAPLDRLHPQPEHTSDTFNFNDVAEGTVNQSANSGLPTGEPGATVALKGATGAVDSSIPNTTGQEDATAGRLRATNIAAKAADLVGGDRDRQHGAKEDNFRRIATMWNAWLKARREPGAELTAHDVGILMALMKLARTQSGALNLDDYVDACGYAACAGEVAQHGA